MVLAVICVSSWIVVIEWCTPILADEAYNQEQLNARLSCFGVNLEVDFENVLDVVGIWINLKVK